MNRLALLTKRKSQNIGGRLINAPIKNSFAFGKRALVTAPEKFRE